MKHLSLTGLLAAALLPLPAASQTIVVVRPLPFTGVPRILPAPHLELPLPASRLPSPLPLNMPVLPLSLTPALAAAASAAVPVALAAPTALAAPAAVTAPAAPAKKEVSPALRDLFGLGAKDEKKAGKKDKELLMAVVFDGRRLPLPEDQLEHELGLR